MEQFNAITKLQNKKRQPNENSIYNYILKTAESLTTEQLELENKPHSGRYSYLIVENDESTFTKEASIPSDTIFPEEKSVTRPSE